jgi:hypothetical protein
MNEPWRWLDLAYERFRALIGGRFGEPELPIGCPITPSSSFLDATSPCHTTARVQFRRRSLSAGQICSLPANGFGEVSRHPGQMQTIGFPMLAFTSPTHAMVPNAVLFYRRL